jgi:hypothetical protein
MRIWDRSIIHERYWRVPVTPSKRIILTTIAQVNPSDHRRMLTPVPPSHCNPPSCSDYGRILCRTPPHSPFTLRPKCPWHSGRFLCGIAGHPSAVSPLIGPWHGRRPLWGIACSLSLVSWLIGGTRDLRRRDSHVAAAIADPQEPERCAPGRQMRASFRSHLDNATWSVLMQWTQTGIITVKVT